MIAPLDLYWSYIHHHCSSWSCNLNWVMCFASLAFEFCIWIWAGRFCGVHFDLLMISPITLSSCNRFAHGRTSEWHCKCMG
ncbi:hypothetical protein NC651_035508 [Populus alba x Populus x berolinensis]|nr:hypothetical protein NC651_035508 [Populus alba x Populus x berolinensis]